MDYVYPPVCAGCERPNYRFCPDCLSRVILLKASICPFCGKNIQSSQLTCVDCSGEALYFTKTASWAEYTEPLRSAIHALKYKNDIGLAEYFSQFLIRLLEEKRWDFNLVVPVPLYKKRLRERSYNQSALIARQVANYFQVEYSSTFLKRTKDTGSQITRSGVERRTALIDAFSGNPAKLKGKKVLLLDDIITTGSTVNFCSKALMEAGVEEVNVISIAMTRRKI